MIAKARKSERRKWPKASWSALGGRIRLYRGNAVNVLGKFPRDRISAVLTDPPYGLKFMGKSWDHSIPGEAFWAAMLKTCKPGSPLLSFGGTRTYHRLTCAIEDAGWEIRDCLMWLYGQGLPKSLDVSKAIDKAAGVERERIRDVRSGVAQSVHAQDEWTKANKGSVLDSTPVADAARLWNGWGTALKPAWEPIVLAMKPPDGTFAANAMEHGVAGLNVDGCRIAGVNPSIAMRTSARKSGRASSDLHSAMNARAGIKPFQGDVAQYCKERPGELLGRWPANVILQHHPDCPVGMLGEQSGESTSQPVGSVARAKQHDGFSGKSFAMPARESPNGHGDTGTAARFFYCAKASRAERSCNGQVENTHPTVKPLDLVRWLARLTKTPTGGTVLDPFMGSATTALACIAEGRRFVGIEKNPENFRIARDRIKAHLKERS